MDEKRPNFSQFDKLKVKPSATAIFTFEEIEGEPALEVRPIGEQNKQYTNNVLKKGKKTLRTLQKGKMSVKTLKENREQDYCLFSRFVVVKWPTAPVDMDGNEVPFSIVNCETFLRAVPVRMFNELREFCGEDDNFLEEDELDADDREELVKN